MANSLDTIHRIMNDQSPLNRVLGSSDSVRPKKRRTKRPRRRCKSADNIADNVQQSQSSNRDNTSKVDDAGSDSLDDISLNQTRRRSRSVTKTTWQRRSQLPAKNGTSTDDEDSENDRNIETSIRNLQREPRSGRDHESGENDV